MFTKRMAAATLATLPALKASGGGSTVGSKTQLGVNHLTLSEEPARNIQLCLPERDAFTGRLVLDSDEISLVIGSFERNTTSLIFTVAEMKPDDRHRIVALLYSTRLSPSPQIPTPISANKLELDLTYAEVVGIYNIPPLEAEPQYPTRIGLADPIPANRLVFRVNLDNLTLPALMNNGQSTLYMQAALLDTRDFHDNYLENMILSELDTIHLIPDECPAGSTVYRADMEGVVTRGTDSTVDVPTGK